MLNVDSIYFTLLLSSVTVVTILYIALPELNYLITGSLYLLTTFTISPARYPPLLVTTSLFSVSMNLIFLESTYK